MRKLNTILALVAMVALSACGKKVCADPQANNFDNEEKKYDNSTCTYDERPESLYNRLGAIDGVSDLVDEFIANIFADESIRTRFIPTVSDNHRYNLFRLNLIDQFCELAEGPCTYKGETMLEAHTGMNISKEEYDALIAALELAMEELEIAEFDQEEILRGLSPMEDDIVGQ